MRARLVVVEGNVTPRVFEISRGEQLILGRSQKKAMMVLSDDYVSSTHARIYNEGIRWFLENEGQNGTLVNGKRYDREDKICQLENSSEIQIINNRFKFTLVQAGPSPDRSEDTSAQSTMRFEDEIKQLHAFISQTSKEVDLKKFLELAMEYLQVMLRANVIGYLRSDPILSEPKLVIPRNHSLDIQLSQKLSRWATVEGGTVQLRSRSVELDSASLADFKDALCAPLVYNDKKFGTLHVYSHEREFTSRDKSIFEIALPFLIGRINQFQEQSEALYGQRVEDSADSSYVMVGQSPPMQELLRQIKNVSRHEKSVLILGESGVGKELVAREIHKLSLRAGRGFVPVNCAAIPDGLLESHLFGHEIGAFTGATKKHIGVFREADDGILFLDELGEMSDACQAKLLRVLEQGTIRSVGGSQDEKVDVRIIAATNADLAKMKDQKRFRADLFYRLNVLRVIVPPLRERLSDIPLLIEHFAKKNSDVELRIDESGWEALQQHTWPGNIRELRNTLDRIYCNAADMVINGDLVRNHLDEEYGQILDLPELNIEKLEILAIEQALKKTNWNMARAALITGLNRDTLYRKLAKHGIRRPESNRDDIPD